MYKLEGSYITEYRNPILFKKLFPYTSEASVTNTATSTNNLEDKFKKNDQVLRITESLGSIRPRSTLRNSTDTHSIS